MKLIVIGSDSGTQIKLNSPYVSKYHAELLLLDNGEILLTDKGSKNGTFINDHKIQANKEVPVKRGDIIRFADQKLNWSMVPTINLDPTVVKAVEGIGTNFRNKHQIQGNNVSRFHATFKKMKDGKWYIQDHSTNGTTVNGQKIASDRDVLLKRGDEILCAGIPVKNPYPPGPNPNWKKIAVVFTVVIALGATFGLLKNTDSIGDLFEGGYTSEELYEKYHSATTLIYGTYYYKISAGGLNLKNLGLPTEISFTYDKNGKKQYLEGADAVKNPIAYTGTGFYISDDGKIATNLHVVRPWLFKKEKDEIADLYKQLLAKMGGEVLSILNAYISQIKVEGVLSYIGVMSDGSYYSVDNLKKCHEFIGHENVDMDVAILQLDTKTTPDECARVDVSKAVVDSEKIKVGGYMWYVGFPGGESIAITDLDDIQSTSNEGTINKKSDKYSFGFSAASYGGASGSPVFNKHGKLIGVLNAGFSQTQGFNRAIKARYLVELLNEVK